MNKIKNNLITFDNIKHIDENGNEYWSARELMSALTYKKWQKFVNVIETSKISCKKSNNIINNHFTQVGKMITIAKGGKRKILDYHLSRYACYLIAQNSDPRKEVVALAQTYFAIQARKQELFEKNYNILSEDEKRLYNRNLTKKANYNLNQTAMKAGVKNFDKFHNAGYKGLYNGETADNIAKRKGLRYREDILDNMGSEELADNLFRIVQTESKLKNKITKTEKEASSIHYNMGKSIRNFIKKHNGTMPEDLPTPKKSLKEIEYQNKNIT